MGTVRFMTRNGCEVEFEARGRVSARERRLREAEAMEQALCAAWSHPAGTRVVVTLDDGSERETATRSQAWMLGAEPSRGRGGHTAVVLLDGISGGYALRRVRLATVAA